MADNFMLPGAIEKFDVFNRELAELVSVRYGGSLKAEHGTGRAIAPFVEAEWGTKAYVLMHKIKAIFDPEGLLNPGVLLNPDPDIHIKSLKLMPLADPVIDLCIECGFCEPACPATHLTLSPRQRIAVTRERARLRQTGEDDARLQDARRRLRVRRPQHLRRRQRLRHALPGGHRDRHHGDRRTRPPPHRRRAPHGPAASAA